MSRADPIPFETMVFVCAHNRAAGERVACANPGRPGQAILEKLKKAVKERGLEGRIRVCKSGCQDRCEMGPNVIVVDASGKPKWLSGVTPGDVPAILTQLGDGLA